MTTAIAPAPAPAGASNEPFASLVPGSRQMAILMANSAGEPINETDLTRVKNPSSGSVTWEIDENGNTTTTREIVGVLVAKGMRGELWPFIEPKKEAPVIVTNDFVTGYRVSDKLGSIDKDALEKYRTGDRTYDWAAMSSGPDFGWGTGKDGHGKRVKESRIIAILRDGDVWPLLLSVGPGSVGEFMPFLKKLPCYHYEAVIGLGLRKEESKGGQPFSMIVPRLVGQLSPEKGEFVRDLYTKPLTAMFTAIPSMSRDSSNAVDSE